MSKRMIEEEKESIQIINSHDDERPLHPLSLAGPRWVCRWFAKLQKEDRSKEVKLKRKEKCRWESSRGIYMFALYSRTPDVQEEHQ